MRNLVARPDSGDQYIRRVDAAYHPEEWLSIGGAILLALLGAACLWGWPDYEPQSNGVVWTIPIWIAFLYVLIQITCLLVSANQIRALGVLDSMVAVIPFITAIVALVEAGLGHLIFSGYQWMTLSAMLIAGSSEFLLTLWIRFVINRRTISIDSGALT